MQEIVNFKEKNARTKAKKNFCYFKKALHFLRDKDLRAVLWTTTALVCLAIVGAYYLAQTLLSFFGIAEFFAKHEMSQIFRITSLFCEFTLISFSIFPLIMGMRLFCLHAVGGDIDAKLIFAYYKKGKYSIALRALGTYILAFAAFALMSLLISFVGGEASLALAYKGEIVIATALISLVFIAVIALSVFLFIRLLSFGFLYLTSSFDGICSRDARRLSVRILQESKRRVFLNLISSVPIIAVTVLSAGILSFATLPLLLVSRALLEYDIIENYKNNKTNNI